MTILMPKQLFLKLFLDSALPINYSIFFSSTKVILRYHINSCESYCMYIVWCTAGCQIFWRLFRKIKFGSNCASFFDADSKNDIIFQLRCHLEVPFSGFVRFGPISLLLRARELALESKCPEGTISYLLSIHYEPLTATENELFKKNMFWGYFYIKKRQSLKT